MPFSMAGLNASTVTWSKRGTPPYAPVQASSSASPSRFGPACAPPITEVPVIWANATIAADLRNERLCMRIPEVSIRPRRIRSRARLDPGLDSTSRRDCARSLLFGYPGFAKSGNHMSLRLLQEERIIAQAARCETRNGESGLNSQKLALGGCSLGHLVQLRVRSGKEHVRHPVVRERRGPFAISDCLVVVTHRQVRPTPDEQKVCVVGLAWIQRDRLVELRKDLLGSTRPDQ